jgi:hypothetical protein
MGAADPMSYTPHVNLRGLSAGRAGGFKTKSPGQAVKVAMKWRAQFRLTNSAFFQCIQISWTFDYAAGLP